ncbi:MAG TPA: photosynthetic reaction center cytochrome c subunit family protein [Vicinamibacterales bacterium]|nr:photosynthetic reaction center cytochrome c subunit family protein [Vicinamibacterales bacterium]
MRGFSKGAIFTVATITVAWLTSIAFATGAMPTLYAQQLSSAQVAAATPATPQLSDKVFKNVQVLKGIPVDEFMGTMGVFTTSLSLCCGNCHTGAGTSNPKWEDDPPRKRTARAMITMVQNINKTSFGGRQVVTCWTCHRGQTSPSVTPPLDFAYGEAVVNPPDLLGRDPNATKTVDQIFDKFIQGEGGAAKINALTSYSGKGKSLLFGEVGEGNPAEVFAKADGHFAAYVHQQEGDVVRAFDGMSGWWQLPLTVTPQYPLTATLLEGQRFDATMAFPWKIRTFFNNWRVSFGQTIDGTDVDVIQGSLPSGMIGTLYFDKKTGLLKRYIRYANTMVGRIPTQVDYDDYRDVAGVKMPFKFSYAWVSERDDWTMTGYEANVNIDNAKFGRPDPKTAGDVGERKAK